MLTNDVVSVVSFEQPGPDLERLGMHESSKQVGLFTSLSVLFQVL